MPTTTACNGDRKYVLRHTTREVRCAVREILYKIDINTYSRITDDKDLNMNDIARVRIRTTRPLMIDEYRDNRITGSFILIDDSSHETVAAGMIM